MNARFDVRIDVSGAVPLDGRVEIATTVFLPDPNARRDRPIVLVALPGGTFGRAYYDLRPPGRSGYSFADHLAHAGYAVLSFDYVGLGDSTPYEPFDVLTKEIVLASLHAATSEALTRLESGTLMDGVPPLCHMFKVGLGHSFGGYLLTLQQAKHSLYDAVAIIGWSPLVRWDPTSKEANEYRADIASGWDRTTRNPSWRSFFYGDHVPEDVMAYDESLAVRVYPWTLDDDGSRTLNDAEIPLAAEAISVPVFLGFGAVDLTPNPRLEANAYRAASDVTVFELSNAGHCLHVARTRRLFFDRVAGWGLAISRAYG